MNTMLSLSPAQLRQAADLVERIQTLQDKLNAILAVPAPAAETTARGLKQRKLSAQGLANIRAGVRKRMAASQEPGPTLKQKTGVKRKVSAAGRKRLSDLAKARWAKVKAAGRSRL